MQQNFSTDNPKTVSILLFFLQASLTQGNGKCNATNDAFHSGKVVPASMTTYHSSTIIQWVNAQIVPVVHSKDNVAQTLAKAVNTS